MPPNKNTFFNTTNKKMRIFWYMTTTSTLKTLDSSGKKNLKFKYTITISSDEEN